MKPMTGQVSFKAKVRQMRISDTQKRPYVELKARVKRTDSSLKAHQHDYYNSDLFEGMLNNAYRKVVGARTFLYLDALPEGVTVDTSKFLAEVTVDFDQAPCTTCKLIADEYQGFGPPHDGSKRCESGSIASGGTNAHCACDVCF